MSAPQPQTASHKPPITEVVREKWGWFLALGIALLIGGFAMITVPLASSIAVTLVIALVFAIGGVLQIWHAFSETDRLVRVTRYLSSEMFLAILSVDDDTNSLAAMGPVISVSFLSGGDIQVTPRVNARNFFLALPIGAGQSSLPLPPAFR